MVAILTTAAEAARGFHSLTAALSIPESKYIHLIDSEAFQDEFGRFRVWSGNLGALQKGHSSLDYRLRDSPLLSENTIKLLKELVENISQILAVVRGTRLPYEEQAKTEQINEDEDDDFFSDDEDEDDDSNMDTPKTEIEQRFAEIVDILDNLYKLSVRIRKPTLRNRSLKAASYKPKDKETGVDLLDQYANLDRQHTIELIEALRAPHTKNADAKNDVLVDRLSEAITLRRRQFKYWKRHRDKLSVVELLDVNKTGALLDLERPDLPERKHTIETVEAQPGNPIIIDEHKLAPSQRTGKTMLSGTEATHHHQTLDDLMDLQSVTSYATTVRDVSGRGIELPPPPKAATGERDFECPYCFIICPARYGRGRPWRTHLLQDLQPYVCTYAECEDHHLLFRSRREWADHEGEHRKAWRCPEHPGAVFKSHHGLESHLRKDHSDTIKEHQLESIVNIGETSTIDTRERCPICFISSQADGVKDNFHNHVANHLERLASFALPTTDTMGDESNGGSGIASRGRTITTVSSQDSEDDSVKQDSVGEENRHESSIHSEAGIVPPANRRLFSETLGALPDDSGKRLNMLLTDRTDTENADTPDGSRAQSMEPNENLPEDPSSRSAEQDEADDLLFDQTSDSSVSVEYSTEQNDEKWPLLPVSEIPTLRALYRTLKLKLRDQSYAPVDAYNQLISLCFYDITRLDVDAIVNSANRGNKISRSNDTLNHYVHQVAGPGLLEECKKVGPMGAGEAILTAGYNLPSPHIIHTARPLYSGMKPIVELNTLKECYRNSLKIALDNGIQTIAFPCIGTGGCGFPPAVAARIALQEARDYLDNLDKHVATSGTTSFKRIIFCVFNGRDEQAYKNLIPVFFPPTHGDIENTTLSEQTIPDRPRLVKQFEDVYKQVEQVAEDFTALSTNIPEFPPVLLVDLIAISSSLRSLRALFHSAIESPLNVTARILADIDLICADLHDICGSLTEVGEQIKYAELYDQSSSASIWNDHNLYLNNKHGLDAQMLVELSRDFVKVLGDMLQRGALPPHELDTMRIRLANYRLKQTGEGDDRVRDKFEEVMYTREFQRDAISSARSDVVKLHQIPSLARLYQVGELELKPTNSIPDLNFNYTVCLIRGDITRIETDIVCNSTDRAFSGMGTLDRAVFRRGGLDMERDCAKFKPMGEGNIAVTPGYGLPARYVIHAIPPETYRSNTKDVLRQIYREILWTANSLKATSIAIPALGTGRLGYPNRDCASLAIEEVKRFLETAKGSHHIESIVFCVFGSNDEYVYKSLLPIFFPPVDTDLNKPRPMSPPQLRSSDNEENSSPTPGASDPKGRALFNSIGDAVRGLSNTKEPIESDSRSLTFTEEETFIAFEKHARDCDVCHDSTKLFTEGRVLCMPGNVAARHLLRNVHMREDGSIYETVSKDPEQAKKIRISPSGRTAVTNGKADNRLKLERHAPLDLQFDGDIEGRSNTNRNKERDSEFEIREAAYRASAYTKCMELLSTVERSHRGLENRPPFVDLYIPYYSSDIYKSFQQSYQTKVVVPVGREPEIGWAVAHILWHSMETDNIEPLYEDETRISIRPGKVELYRDVNLGYRHSSPSMTIDVDPLTPIFKPGDTDLVVRARPTRETRFSVITDVVFRSKNEPERESLYQLLRDARKNNPTYRARHTDKKPTTSLEEDFPAVDRDDSEIQEESRPTRSGPQVRFELPSVPSHDPVRRTSPRRVELVDKDSLNLDISISNPQGLPRLKTAPSESGPPDANIPSNMSWLKRSIEVLLQRGPGDGIHEKEIAENLGEDLLRVREALHELWKEEVVYTTVNGLTWTSVNWAPPSPTSGPSSSKAKDKPSQQEPEIETGPFMELPDPATSKMLERALPGLSHINLDRFYTYLDSALEYDFDKAVEAKPQSGDFDEEDAHLSTVSNPRPTTPDEDQGRPIPPAARWTKIESWIVSPEALTEAKEPFEMQGNHVVVFRVLSREEIMKLAEATRKIMVRDHGYVEF